jgi:hydroxymethylpyrimidine/phosphomethylpyrimidine kinase
MRAVCIVPAAAGGCTLAAAVAIELATGDPPAGANYGEAEPVNMHEAEL